MALAQLFQKVGDHHQAAEHYKRLFRVQKDKNFIKKEDYFQEWALETYYEQNWGDLMTFMTCNL